MTGMSWADLMLDNGELIRIEYPEQFEDEVLETISNTLKRGDEWSPRQWEGCHAEYLGIGLDVINMKRVVGRL